MKKFVITLLLISAIGQAFAQSSGQEIFYSQQVEKADKLATAGNYTESVKLTQQVLDVFPDHLGANTIQAFSQINLGILQEAKTRIAIGLQVDPTFYGLHYCVAYLQTAEGNPTKAKEALTLAIQYSPVQLNMTELKSEFETVGKNIAQPEAMKNLFDWYQQSASSIKKVNTLTESWNLISSISTGADDVKKETNRLANEWAQANRNDLVLAIFYYGSLHLNNSGFPSEALELAMAGYSHYKKNGFDDNHYQAARLLAHLMQLNINKLDYDGALAYQADAELHNGKSGIATYDVLTTVLTANATANSIKGKVEENQEKARKLAIEAYNRAKANRYGFGMALASNAIVITHDDAKNAATGVQYGEYGHQLARDLNLDIKETIASNLAFCYYGLGTSESKQQAYNLYRKQAEKALQNGNWEAAATDMNNLGMLVMFAENWENAAALFEEVVKLEGYSPKYSNYRDRLTFYKRQVAAYQNLIKCYAHLGNAEKAFQAMEASRSRVLLERLGQKNYKPVSLADLQNLLKPDEACIMYSLTAGHEIIILTVSKKYAQVLFHEDPRFIGDLKDKYWNKGQQEPVATRRDEANLNKFVMTTLRSQVNVARDNYDKIAMAPKSDLDKAYQQTNRFLTLEQFINEPKAIITLEDYLYRFQKYLIVPISNRLTGIKNLIIAPDDVFNFIPFEALRAFDGKYMVEKYNFRYIHSASVLMHLQQRSYTTSRKPLLAMGGATYEQMSQAPAQSHTDSEMNLLETEVYENIKTGKSQRKAYATLLGQGPMNYLKGSLEEVKNISKSIPGAETYTGTDMTENRIKEMSKGGQLKNYKILHLATHGFVVPEIPDLSGLAMTIFKSEQGGEDGYLTSPEIASLELNADLTVLSACETAQGKFFAGEGVTGITQSLMVAGSNAALVSLWKVNDEATMIFMSNFYKEVAKGKPYVQIVNDLKKKFIKGDFGKEFQHPNFWAPFIYYGQ